MSTYPSSTRESLRIHFMVTQRLSEPLIGSQGLGFKDYRIIRPKGPGKLLKFCSCQRLGILHMYCSCFQEFVPITYLPICPNSSNNWTYSILEAIPDPAQLKQYQIFPKGLYYKSILPECYLKVWVKWAFSMHIGLRNKLGPTIVYVYYRFGVINNVFAYIHALV